MNDFLEYDENENLQNKLQNMSESLDKAIDEKAAVIKVIFRCCYDEHKRFKKFQEKYANCKCICKCKKLKKKMKAQWERVIAVYCIISELKLEDKYKEWERNENEGKN